MSHTVTIKTELRDAEAIRRAAGRIGAHFIGIGQDVTLYDKSTHHGTAVRLQGWDFPLCITDCGEIKYDNFCRPSAGFSSLPTDVQPHYRSLSGIDALAQAYAAEVAIAAMQRDGWIVNEAIDSETGEIRLTCFA